MHTLLPAFPRLLLLTLALAAGACTPLVAEEQRTCPCAAGWTCCDGLCVPGGPGACSVPDREAPAAPRLEAATPASPTATSQVQLQGHAEPHARVRLYTRPDCEGAVAAAVTADAAGRLSAGVALAPNTASVFYARATDAAGNGSQCSAPGLSVTHDDVPPAPPTLSRLAAEDAASPAAEGQAEPHAHVALYADAACLTALDAAGQSDAAGTFRLPLALAPRSQGTLYARARDAAGNLSACSAGLAYQHRGLVPEAPTLGGFTPGSPSRERRALWEGRAPAYSRLRLYDAEGCAGESSAELDVGPEGTWALQVEAADNAATRRWATASDAAGTPSDCALLGTYVHDTVAPAFASLGATPTGPTNSPETALYGATEPGATVYVSDSYACAPERELGAGPARADSGDFNFPLALARSTELYARAVDGAGNASACKYAGRFEYDATPPEPPQLLALTAPSPASTDAQEALGLLGRSEANGSVSVYTDAACSVPVAFVDTEHFASASPGTQVNFRAGPLELLPAVDVALYARAEDAAGNVSACTPEPLWRTYASEGLRWRPTEPGLDGQLRALRLDGQGGLWALRTVGSSYMPALEVVRRDVAGGAWGPARQLDPQLNDPEVLLLANARGDVLAAWVSAQASASVPPQVRAARYDAATGLWSETASYDAPSMSGTYLDAALGEDGQALVCWARWGSASAQLCGRAPGGGAWEPAVEVHGGGVDGSLRLLLLAGPDGSARMLWRDSGLRERVYTPGAGWSAARTVAGGVNQAGVHQDADGTAWLAWTAPTPEGGVALWAQRAASTTAAWEPAVRLSPEGMKPTWLQVLTGGGVKWSSSEYYSYVDRLWFSAHGESGWSPALQVGPSGAGTPVAAASGAPGEVWFAAVYNLGPGSGASTLMLHRYTAAGGLEPGQVLTHDPELDVINSPLLTADASGRVAAGWAQAQGADYPASLRPRLRLLR